MNSFPPFLSQGDKIAIVATARKTNPQELKPFIQLAEKNGFEVVFTPNLFNEHRQFAGTDKERAEDFQYWMDNPEIKALLLARGGYGTARMVDYLDFSNFISNPKWLIGFSDFTVIHTQVNCRYQIPTLHAAMPAFLKEDSLPPVIQSFTEMLQVLKGDLLNYEFPEHSLNQSGNCEGILIGGNLSVIYSTMGSISEIDSSNAILFLEDLDEYHYHIDRMMVCLKRAGKLDNLKGVIVGHMNDMHDRGTPFGKSAEEIISEHCSHLNIPMYFGFDAGHMRLNHPLIFGTKVKIENNSLIFEAKISK